MKRDDALKAIKVYLTSTSVFAITSSLPDHCEKNAEYCPDKCVN